MTILPKDVIEDALSMLLRHSGLVDIKSGSQLTDIHDSSIDSMLVARLDSEIDQSKLLLDLFKDGVCRKIADLCHHRNRLAPIYRLPSELLADIFQRVQSAEDSTVDAYVAIKRLAGVSSRWFATVISTAYLWTHLDSTSHPTFTKSIIARSRGLPLHLSCTNRGGTMTEESAFLDLVIGHADRWQTFQSSGHIMKLLTKWPGTELDLPLLEVFEANPSRHHWPEVPEVILRRSPLLHTLSIPSCNFPRGGLVFSSITKLKFTPVSGGRMLSSDHWRSLLSNTLQLEFLHVIGHIRTREEPVAFCVVLPKLERIILETLPIALNGDLLSSICYAPQTFPLVEIRRADLPMPDNEFDILFPEAPQPQSLLHLIRSMKWMTVQCPSSIPVLSIEAGWEPGRPILDFRSSLPPSPGSIFETLVPSAGLLELESLSVCGAPLFECSAFLQRLRCFPSLKKLSISLRSSESQAFQYRKILTRIFDVLGSPIIGGDRSATNWYLSQLKELDVGSVGGFEALLPFIQSRCKSANTPGEPNLLPSLEVLRLRPLSGSLIDTEGPLDEEFLEELRNMFVDRSTELFILPIT